MEIKGRKQTKQTKQGFYSKSNPRNPVCFNRDCNSHFDWNNSANECACVILKKVLRKQIIQDFRPLCGTIWPGGCAIMKCTFVDFKGRMHDGYG